MIMPWTIDTNPLGHAGLSAAAAAIPILYLFWALAWKRMKGHWAALSAVLVATAVAVVIYGMPLKLGILSALFGVLFGLWPICWIVFTAIFIYNLSCETGEFEVIKNSLAAISDDRRMQALLIAFCFGAFIEGAAGLGTPVAITAAMLAGLGFKPLQAAGLCLLANTVPVAYGGVGLPILIAAQVSGLGEMELSRSVGQILSIVSLFIPMYMLVLICGFRKALDAWPAALVSGGSFALTQWLVSSYLGPYLPSIAAALVSLACLFLFLRFWHPRERWCFPDEIHPGGKAPLLYSPGRVFRAWAPFIILSILVAAWGIRPIKEFLDQFALVNIPIAGLDRMIIRDGEPVTAVFSWNILSSAGTAIFFAGILSIPVMGASAARAAGVFVRTLKMLGLSIVTIMAILGFAYVMNFSGMAVTLGQAFAVTGAMYPFFAAFIGWIGVFMTGSDSSANALFGKLQEVTARQIGIDPVVTVAANSAGGVSGKLISPQSISIATAAAHLAGHEGDLFRYTLKHSILITAVIGALSLILARLH